MKNEFDKLYFQIILEMKEEKMITEDIGKKLALGTFALTSLMAPMNIEAAPKKVESSIEINSNYQLVNYATNLIKNFEGSVKDSSGNHIVYDDAQPKKRWNNKQNILDFISSCKGKATIGYGETDKNIVKKGKISEAEAISLLQKRIIKLNKQLFQKFGRAYSKLNIVQKSVLISFYYNLGIYFKAPKMEANLRAGKLKEAAKEFLDCDNTTVKGVKQKSPGLTKRRKIEHDLFIKNIK